MQEFEEARGKRLELWGGAECSIVRIGDEYRNQSAETGHEGREGDLDLIADLGIKAIRHPILWEALAPTEGREPDFSGTDKQLARLRDKGVEVIAGLLHHGSGPRHTNLLDPDFPRKFAEYAGQVARRYPWIDRWTPVNEPLTTARFSALYGHWYPHRRDMRSFLRALINEARGTLEAMRAIRGVNPDARLVQTEDLGKVFSTPPLRHQADHENERRWLSLDLLCGRIDPSHEWHEKLLDAGASADEIAAFEAGDARPDLIGINHYLTSDRFLDHRLHLYPDEMPGGNGHDVYVDVEAVRVATLEADCGLVCRLREAWERYHIPMAITEVHHGCTRDEQLRWLSEVWRTAEALRGDGVDLRSVTLWSIFGTVDWRSLLTARAGHYDVGAFDIRGPEPRPTAIAAAAKAFASGRDYDHPALDRPGWWRRPERFYSWQESPMADASESGERKLLITGATGTLGNALARICEHRGLPYEITTRSELDLGSTESVAAAIAAHRPWAVINAAGFVRVADAEHEAGACMAANAAGPARLAKVCAETGIPFVTFSSDLVFDGRAGRAYREEDEVGPTGVYGRSKAEAERAVLTAHDRALVVRTSAFFGPWDQYNFAWHVLERLGRGRTFEASAKSIVSPTYVPDLCHAALDLLIDGEMGIWHLANQGEVSWHEFARRIAQGAGHDPEMIVATSGGDNRNNALSSGRGLLLRPLDQAIRAYLGDIERLLPAASIAAE